VYLPSLMNSPRQVPSRVSRPTISANRAPVPDVKNLDLPGALPRASGLPVTNCQRVFPGGIVLASQRLNNSSLLWHGRKPVIQSRPETGYLPIGKPIMLCNPQTQQRLLHSRTHCASPLTLYYPALWAAYRANDNAAEVSMHVLAMSLGSPTRYPTTRVFLTLYTIMELWEIPTYRRARCGSWRRLAVV
jgi:hypothetical protein